MLVAQSTIHCLGSLFGIRTVETDAAEVFICMQIAAFKSDSNRRIKEAESFQASHRALESFQSAHNRASASRSGYSITAQRAAMSLRKIADLINRHGTGLLELVEG